MNVLFVCSGNTCRSAMAEGIAKALIKENPQQYRQIRVASAGTFAEEGAQASPLAQAVCRAHGIDLTDFTAQQVSPQLLKNADLVLAMTNSHKKLLNTLAPEAVGKIFLLKEYEYGEDVGALNVRLYHLGQAYATARESFVKANEKRLREMDLLYETDPEEAKRRFTALNDELSQQVKALDSELAVLQDKAAALDIVDPFGGERVEYEACFDQIRASISAVFAKLSASGALEE